MSSEEEWFDVVDEEDRVTGLASRREVHAKKWLHRSAHILVFDSDKRLFLQKRSLNKDENPGDWDISAAGHVETGESYLEAAKRELHEELGIIEDLNALIKIFARDETFGEHVHVYYCETNKKIQINLHEISEGRYWSIDEIKSAIKDKVVRFTPSFCLIFRIWLSMRAV